MLRRLALSLGVTVLVLLAAEGALSLFAGRSLLGPRGAAPAALLHDDAERLALSRLTEGIYRYHPDPLVGMVLKPGDELLSLGVPFSSDALGLRVRPGGAPPDDALRVVVLGDSVAFGLGLRDDETIAAQLERILHDVRGDEAREVACLTVGAPGWNHANAVRFLEDHWQTVRPDVLVYLPIENDLADTFTVTEAGFRRAGVDLSQRDPWLRVDLESRQAYTTELLSRYASGRLDTAGLPADAQVGPPALTSDLSDESRARYDADAASIAHLAALCARNDVPFAVLLYQEQGYAGGYAWMLRERLLDVAPDVPLVPGFDEAPQACRLPGNPHPDAAGTFALARWTAEALLARGFLDRGADRPLPDVSDEAAAHHASGRTADTIRARAREARQEAAALLEPRIDIATGLGTAQIYGGLNPDGSCALRMLALLPPGERLVLRARAEPGGEHLGDVTLSVAVDGHGVGALVLPPDGRVVRAEFALPARPEPDAPFEVALTPDAWFADGFKGRTQLTCGRVLALEVR
ncbi:MAG: SGNH/GDSL hydrolase family protein [Planctomycetes bacterium]|nr:SGNH/GDSL hydrolase family protein [Planctomycetota bacterium]